jgi:flagellar biosynthesis protein FliQ
MFQDIITTLILAFAFTLPSLAISFAVAYLLIMRSIQKIKLSYKPLLLSIMISWVCSALPVAFIGEKIYDGGKYLIVPFIISSIVLYAIYSKTKKENAQEKQTAGR